MTRWSSTFAMAKRFVKLEPFLWYIADLTEHMLTRKEVRMVVKLNEHLADLDSATKTLQADDTDMAVVSVLFDGVIAEHPDLAHYLAPDAAIVQHPDFESGLVKLLTKAQLLTENEKISLKKYAI